MGEIIALAPLAGSGLEMHLPGATASLALQLNGGSFMKLCNVLLAVVGATVLLGALVASASATRLSASETPISATWTRMNFSGGFGTFECEVVLSGRLHGRTITKTVESLIGLITGASIPRCARNGATILPETLPWHVRYAAFAGTLPAVTELQIKIVGMAFRIREPLFGATCLATTTTIQPGSFTFNLGAGGGVFSVSASGRIRTSCGVELELSGDATPAALTITLI